MISIADIKNTVHCADCLDIMKQLPDKCIDLVLTDPPYGIGEIGGRNLADRPTKKWKNPQSQIYKTFDDSKIPDEKYFKDIFRISKNQIIFGANNFTEYLPKSTGWIVWDKRVNPKELLSMCELAFSSFNKRCMKFEYLWAGFKKENPEYRYHVTQKPVALFGWILQNYSTPSMTVFDPFAGSGTTAIACLETGRNYICIEKEPDYVEIINKRIATWKEQGRMFCGNE